MQIDTSADLKEVLRRLAEKFRDKTPQDPPVPVSPAYPRYL